METSLHRELKSRYAGEGARTAAAGQAYCCRGHPDATGSANRGLLGEIAAVADADVQLDHLAIPEDDDVDTFANLSQTDKVHRSLRQFPGDGMNVLCDRRSGGHRAIPHEGGCGSI